MTDLERIKNEVAQAHGYEDFNDMLCKTSVGKSNDIIDYIMQRYAELKCKEQIDQLSIRKDCYVWKEMPGFEGIYMVSNYGDIKSLSRFKDVGQRKQVCELKEKILKPRPDADGYFRVFVNNGKANRKNMGIHRIVALTYIPNPENKPCVNHKDGNKQNNHVSNLEWVTVKENTHHAIQNGLMNPRFKYKDFSNL